MNWPILIIFGIAAITLVVFLIKRNTKDEKVFEDEMNNDYQKLKEEKGDGEIDEVMK